MNRNYLVYIAIGVTIVITIFVSGLLIGRFVIRRSLKDTHELTAHEKDPLEQTRQWNELKQRFLNLVDAQEIEENLR